MTHQYSFDPSSDNWLAMQMGGTYRYITYEHLMGAIDCLFEHSSTISNRYNKGQVIDACTRFGYFSYDGWIICYATDKNQSSLDLMGGL